MMLWLQMMQRSTLGIKKPQPIKGTQEKKLKGNLKFVTGQKERFMKNWLALGGFFFVFSKKKICCSCSICHLLPGSLNVLFQSETYGWWEKVKAEEKQNRSRIRDLHVCSFVIIKAKYRLTWTTHTFPLSEFEYFEKKSSFFSPQLIHVVMAMFSRPRALSLTLTIHDVAINQF